MEDGNFFNQQSHRLSSSYLHQQIFYPSSSLVEAAYNTTNFETPLHVQNNPSNTNINVDNLFMDGDRTCKFNMVNTHEDAQLRERLEALLRQQIT